VLLNGHLNHRIARRISIPVLLASVLGAGACGEEVVAYTRTMLPTGQEIRLISMEPTRLPDGKRALSLLYQTDLAADDLTGLQKETHQIWTSFVRPQAEQAEIDAASVVATSLRQQGWELAGFEFTMKYRRDTHGNWTRN
jgi:hypothetical protein